MNAYTIFLKSTEGFKVLITMRNSEAPLQYFRSIERELSELDVSGEVLLDQMLHVGNTEERFISMIIKGKNIDESSLRFVRLKKSSEYRQLTCKLLKEERLVENSILSKIQKKMILKGMSI
ncbi:hypothetical protein SANA_12300 [Gottschalkiaceae bacterium SANA]|nr:hypothetical protein SANA_12300 [Gottschalkiaceae bacterium SANA]